MRKLRATTALVGLLLLPLISLASPQKTTTLTVGGYAGATTLANFPVLVRLSAARVDGFDPHDCAANGADVWFASDAEGANPIPHEIERWDDTGESAIWVRVPELAASSPQPTTFYMFWKDDAPPANETTNVWSGADYRAVWHFGEASTTQRDSTATGLAATLLFDAEPAPVTNGTVVARRVEPASRYRAKGRPVWLGTDNEPYLHDAAGDAAKPWRPCRKYGARLTDAEAAAIGVSLAAQPISDAFAAPRRKAKCALGNLNPRSTGAALRLR